MLILFLLLSLFAGCSEKQDNKPQVAEEIELTPEEYITK